MRLVNWNTEKTVFRECDGGNVMWECGAFSVLQAWLWEGVRVEVTSGQRKEFNVVFLHEV